MKSDVAGSSSEFAKPSGLSEKLEVHHEAAFGWALSCCAWDRTLAEDVLQTAYCKVLEGRAKFAGRSSFKTWLFAVIRITASEERRRHALRRFVPLAGLEDRLRSGATSSEEQLLISEEARRMVGALTKLPRRQREVLHLVFYSDFTISEAATLLGVSLGTARTHYERGKGRLRQLLKEDARE